MSIVVLDDHLLRDVLAGETRPSLRAAVRRSELATTNLWYVRLCRSVSAARGGRLTGALTAEQRQPLGRQLVELPESVVVPRMQDLAPRMAELASSFGLSALGSEAVAAAEGLGATVLVWAGDDGQRLRSACQAVDVDYRTID